MKEMIPRKYESESRNWFSLFNKAICLNFNATTGNTHGIKFNIIPPTHIDLSLHKDWSLEFGNKLLEECSFFYEKVSFKEIAKAKRK